MAGVWVIASDRGAISEDVNEGIDGNVISVDSDEDLLKTFAYINENKDFFLNYRDAGAGNPLRRAADQGEELVGIYNHFFDLGTVPS